MKLLLRLFFTLLALVFWLSAPAANAEGAPQPMVSVKFTVIGWSGEPSTPAYKQEGKLRSLEMLPFVRSKPYDYNGPAEMELYSPDAKDEKVGTVVFPVGPKRFTVLIGGQPGHYQTRVIADDETTFPIGSARVLNLTSTRMLFRYNQAHAITIDAGKHAILRPREDLQLVAETAFERNGKWRRSNDDFIYVPSDGQTSVFYFENDSSYFKSIDGGSREVQMLILLEKPAPM